MVTTSQELRHSTKKFMKLVGVYLGEESPLCHSMATWHIHIERLEQQYDKVFSKDPLSGSDLIYIIHKRVQVFLHFFNMMVIEDVHLGFIA